jgi:2-hydroxychromene-2-carboxylate isomerase
MLPSLGVAAAIQHRPRLRFSMPTLEFFYDCSSPWTYLAFHQIERLAARGGAELIWRPILVGGVFNAVNQGVYETRSNPLPRKAAYYQKDQQDWARLYGLRIGSPPVFPVNSVKAMRAAFVAQEHGKISPFSRAVFEAYWGDLQDISQDDVLRRIVERVGLDWTEVSAKIASDDYKKKLRDNVEELIARGGFGSPTMFVDRDDMYFGNDRLPLVEAALARAGGAKAAAGG